MTTSTSVHLAKRPVGTPVPDDWEVRTTEIPEPGDRQFVVRVQLISLDPAMRGWLNDAPSYVPPVGIGEVMRAGGVGEVVASRHPKYPVGTLVEGVFGVQEYALSDGGGVTIVDPRLGTPSSYLGVLGITGLTAYFGMFEHGKPRAGDTVLVSGAAGGVGSIAGQLARIGGCRAVGVAGGPEKCAHVTDVLGFDSAIDYKADGFSKAVAAACPRGIDVYFDNVGGKVLTAALANLAWGARVVLCGAISQYNAEGRPEGPYNYMALLVKRATMSGYLYFDYAAQFSTARRRLSAWVADGKLVATETVVPGTVTDFHDMLMRLFAGDNTGKLILDISA